MFKNIVGMDPAPGVGSVAMEGAITVRLDHRGDHRVDVRIHLLNEDGEVQSLARGFSMPASRLDDLIEVLTRAHEAARARGRIV